MKKRVRALGGSMGEPLAPVTEPAFTSAQLAELARASLRAERAARAAAPAWEKALGDAAQQAGQLIDYYHNAPGMYDPWSKHIQYAVATQPIIYGMGLVKDWMTGEDSEADPLSVVRRR